MARPIIGISANTSLINDTYQVQATGQRNVDAITEATGCMAIVIPGCPDAVTSRELMGILDGVLLTGGRPNVHPSFYGHDETEAHGPFDRGRDDVCLPLIRDAVEIGMPIFGICRGIQEINVAFGGTLHPEIRDLPGRMNHRMPKDEKDLEVIFKKRHKVALTKGGYFERLLGTDEIETNSLHGQGLIELGDGVMVEGVCDDGTIEAISMPSAPGLVLGVQWHAEYGALEDPVSAALFGAFGDAARTWRMKKAA